MEGTVRNFFRNYLLDKIRGLPNTVQTSTFDDDDDESFVARISAPESEDHELREFLNEVPVETLTKSASDFFDSLEERHRLMLTQHYCADSPVPMLTLFKGVNRITTKRRSSVSRSARDRKTSWATSIP